MCGYCAGPGSVNICFSRPPLDIDWKYSINYRNHWTLLFGADLAVFNIVKHPIENTHKRRLKEFMFATKILSFHTQPLCIIENISYQVLLNNS